MNVRPWDIVIGRRLPPDAPNNLPPGRGPAAPAESLGQPPREPRPRHGLMGHPPRDLPPGWWATWPPYADEVDLLPLLPTRQGGTPVDIWFVQNLPPYPYPSPGWIFFCAGIGRYVTF